MTLRTAGRFISRRLLGGTRNFSGNSTPTEDVGAKIKDRNLQILYRKVQQAELEAKEIQEEFKESFANLQALRRNPGIMVVTVLVNLSLASFIYRRGRRITQKKIVVKH